MTIFLCLHLSVELPNKRVSILSSTRLSLYCNNSNIRFNSLSVVHQIPNKSMENIVLIEWNTWHTSTLRAFGVILMRSLLMELWSILVVITQWCHHYLNPEESCNMNFSVVVLLWLLSEREGLRTQFFSLISKLKKETVSILCPMMLKILKDVCDEL